MVPGEGSAAPAQVDRSERSIWFEIIDDEHLHAGDTLDAAIIRQESIRARGDGGGDLERVRQ